MGIDFSDLGAQPIKPALDFSDLGAQPITGDPTAAAKSFSRDKYGPGLQDATVNDASTIYGIGSLGKTGLALAAKGTAALADASPMFRGLITSPEALSPEFEAGKTAAGISGDLPIQRGAAAKFPKQDILAATKQPRPIVPAETIPSVSPMSYPSDPAAFINFAKARVSTFGDKLSPQELDDYKTILSKMFKDGSLPSGTNYAAQGAQLKSEVTNLHNAAIPGREELNEVFGWAKKFHPDIAGHLVDIGKKYGKYVLYGALSKLGWAGFSKGGH